MQQRIGLDTRGRREKRADHYTHEHSDPRVDLRAADFIETGGDVNLFYGGTFVRPEIVTSGAPHYADVIEIVDLDSACGASGVNLIELKTVSLEFKRDQSLIHELKRALETCGQTRRDIAEIAKTHGARTAYAHIAALLADYGACDTDQSWLAVTDTGAAHYDSVRYHNGHGRDGAYSWIGRGHYFTQNAYNPSNVIADHGDAALSLAINAAINAA